MTTFNKSEIFKNAWTIVRTAGKTLSEALKAAWVKAKTVTMEKAHEALRRIEGIYGMGAKLAQESRVVLSIPFADSKGREWAKKDGFRWNAEDKTWFKVTNYVKSSIIDYAISF